MLQSILMLMMMGGLYFELQSPGVGFAGLMALIGAALFFAPHYMLGLVESWEIALFVLGVILLGVEIFVIPGFGVAGLAGLLLVVGSLLASLVGNVNLSFPGLPEMSSALTTLAVTMVLLVLLVISLARFLPSSGRFNRMVLAPELSSTDGYTAAVTHHELLGQTGAAVTPLRPSGTIQLTGENSQRVDVVTAGEFIETGAVVKVVDVRGSRVEVRQVQTLAGESETSAT